MFEWWGRAVVRLRWAVLAAGLALAVVGVTWGAGVFGALTSGGFEDPGSESTRAVERITAELGDQDVDILALYSSDGATVDEPAFRQPVEAALDALRARPEVESVTYRMLQGGARQMVISVPFLRNGATARAVVAAPPGSEGLQAFFAARLVCLFGAVDGLWIVSGFRTRAEQAALYEEKPGLAAPPGQSNARRDAGAAQRPDLRPRRQGHGAEPHAQAGQTVSFLSHDAGSEARPRCLPDPQRARRRRRGGRHRPDPRPAARA